MIYIITVFHYSYNKIQILFYIYMKFNKIHKVF
jgi:hypothetical protein